MKTEEQLKELKRKWFDDPYFPLYDVEGLTDEQAEELRGYESTIRAAWDIGAARRSDREVNRLKRDWCADPCYDLESVHGFAAHREELAEFSKRQYEIWEKQREQELLNFSAKIGLQGNVVAAEFIMGLESSIKMMSKELENAYGKILVLEEKLKLAGM